MFLGEVPRARRVRGTLYCVRETLTNAAAVQSILQILSDP
jgi:hypothetical protein